MVLEVNQKCKYLIKVGNHSNLNFLFESNSLEEVKEEIHKYINNNIDNCYYTRVIFGDLNLWIDYGSWDDLIFLFFSDYDAKNEYIGGEIWEQVYKK